MTAPQLDTFIKEIVDLNLASRPTGRPARRGQHPKHHGCARARFRVHANIPENLRYGLFAHPGEYDALVRFSNGRVFDDRKADAHGMAIKLLDVCGPKLLDGRTHESAQDFALVDSETFFTGDPTEYLIVNRAGMATGAERLKAWLSLLIRPALLLRMLRFISKRPHSPIDNRYFSAVPYRLGPLAVKYAALPRHPISPGPAHGPDGLVEALQRRLANCGASFAFALDIQSDGNSQPIDDPTVAWSRAGAKRIVVADLILPRQELDRSTALAENLQFSPWHTLEAHCPIGFINEARRPVYREMAKARHQSNGVEPLETSEAPHSYADPLQATRA